MSAIFLDGELVRFEGPVPASLEGLLTAVEPGLAAAGRVLAGVAIDGRPAEISVDDDVFGAARRIDISSLSINEAVAQLASACAGKAFELRGEAGAVSQEVLRQSWFDFAPRLVDLGERLGGLLHDLGCLSAEPEWQARGGELAAVLDRWMDAVAARDAAGVCLCFENSILPLLERIASSAELRRDAARA